MSDLDSHGAPRPPRSRFTYISVARFPVQANLISFEKSSDSVPYNSAHAAEPHMGDIMAVLESALRRFGLSMGVAAAKRQVEETLQPVLEDAIRRNLDENQTLNLMGEKIVRNPVFRIALHSSVSAVGSVFAEHADDLWPGDDRAFTRTMRAALKRLGPQLHFASDIGADALERAVKERADGIVSPATTEPAARKAEADWVFLWFDEFPDRILFPARNDDGSINWFDVSRNLPFILDREVMARMTRPKYTQPTVRMVSGGKGQEQRPVTDPPERPNISKPFALRDAVQMVDKGRWDPASAEAIQKMLAPKTSYFASWGDDVWEVVRAYNATFATRKAQTGFDWLDQEESEGLVQTMLKAQPDIALLRELVGKGFKTRIGQNGARPGELSLQDCDELEQIVFDQWCMGEQPKLVKALRMARRLRRHGAMRGVSPLSVMLSVVGITSAIWMPVVGMALVMLVAVLMFVQGVFTPLNGGSVPYLGVAYNAKSFAMACVFLAGWLAFAVTWTFPVFQTATAWVRTLFPSLKEDWLVSLGRRIVAFALLFCSGIEFYAVALNAAPIWRVVVLAVAGVGIAVTMGLVEARNRYKAEEMVVGAAKPTLVVFGLIPLALVFTVGVAQGNPVQTSTVWSSLSGLTAWHWAGIGALAVFGLFIVSLFFGKSKEGTGGGDRAMTLASIFCGFALLAVLCGFGLAGLDKIGGWFGNDPAPATTTVVMQPQDNGPWFDRAVLCADPKVPEHQRLILNCP